MAGKGIQTRQIFIFLACYFFLQAALRVLVSDAAELDESEQVLLTQGFRWGYGVQPPLYTWLQAAVFAVTHVNVLGLALFKMVLLFGTTVFIFLAAREITENEKAALLATLSLLLVPQFVWESQRDLTHSVLATMVGAATLAVAARLFKQPTITRYVLLGASVGVGILSKYNYLLFVAALLLAAISVPRFRSAVLNWRMVLSFLVALVITAPHLGWLMQQGGPGAVSKIHLGGGSGLSVSRLLSPVTSAAFFLVGLVPVYLFFFGKALRSRHRDFENLLLRTFALGVLFGTVMALGSNTRFQVRWMQPILFAVPIYFAALVIERLTEEKFRRMVTLCAVVAIGVLIALPITPVIASITHRPTRLNAPYSALSQELKKAGVKPDVILAGSRLLAGNLRFGFVQSTVLAPEFFAFDAAPRSEWLVVWDATKSQEPPDALLGTLSRLRGMTFAGKTPRYVEAPLKYTGDKRMKLGFIVFAKSEL